MATEGIEAVFMTTHNWGKAASFYRSLGYELDFETDHHSGQLRNGDGPVLFIAEVPESEEIKTQLTLHVADAATLDLDAGIEVVRPMADTHWGTQEMAVRDPDGRELSLQAPKP